MLHITQPESNPSGTTSISKNGMDKTPKGSRRLNGKKINMFGNV